MKTEKKLTSATADAATVAKFVGLTPKRISQLASENRIPSADAGGLFPLAATVAKYCEFLRARADVGTITQAKRRRLEAQATMSEMELARKRKELVELSAVEKVWTANIIAAREIVCRSALSRNEQDEILNQLAEAKAENYLQSSTQNKP